MPNIIKLTMRNGDVWVNANKIMYMKRADGETAVFCEGSSVALFVLEEPLKIRREIENNYGGNEK